LNTNLPFTYGEAIAPSYSPDPKYNDSIAIGEIEQSMLLAHEIGHILLNNKSHLSIVDNSANKVYLMTDKLADHPRDVEDASLRISSALIRILMTERPELLRNPVNN